MARGTKRRATPSRAARCQDPKAASDRQGAQAEAQYDCEDENHTSDMPVQELRRSRRDGVLRCLRCRQGQQRKLMVVGTRGLDLAAHFRRRRTTPAVEVVPSSPEADDEEEQCLDACGGRPSITQMPLEVRRCSPSKPSLNVSVSDDALETDVPPSESSDMAAPKRKIPKVLHIGCDVCPRWYVVDKLLFEHWRDARFTCCMIGERCGRKEMNTALVSCPGVPGMLSRMGLPCILRESRPHILPLGYWDLWRPHTALTAASPRIFAAPLSAAGAERAQEVERVLHAAFEEEDAKKTISRMLGRHRRVAQGAAKLAPPKFWLLWQESQPQRPSSSSAEVVAAAILSWQRYTTVGPRELQGGVVLEYIAKLPDRGAKAYNLILAAEEVALLLGHTELFSACDLNQDGAAFNGKALPALEAHQRWGFQDTDQKEWRDRRLESYDDGCSVHYMVKTINR